MKDKDLTQKDLRGICGSKKKEKEVDLIKH